MKLSSAIEAYGTSEGVEKGWDSRGRGRKQKSRDHVLYHAIRNNEKVGSYLKKGILPAADVRGGSHVVYLGTDSRVSSRDTGVMMFTDNSSSHRMILKIKVPDELYKKMKSPSGMAEVTYKGRIPPEYIHSILHYRVPEYQTFGGKFLREEKLK